MTRIVLVGCGHAHLAVVERAAEFRARGIELVLIDLSRFWYSGRGSGVLGGRFDAAEATIDPRRLSHACGIRLVEERVVGLDRAGQTVLLGTRDRVGYDLVSFAVGSQVSVPQPFAGCDAASVKPIGALAALREEIAGTAGPQRIMVVGGGATGCEITGNLLHLGKVRQLAFSVTLVSSAASLLPGAPHHLQRAALGSLTGRGAKVHLGASVARAEPGRIWTSAGQSLGYDRLILATGLEAAPLMGALGLPAMGGGLRVGPTLQSLSDPRVFAAGDCAALEGHDLPKLGVYGVRAGAVLARNLLAAAEGRALADYRPQRRALSIVDLADGRGLAMRGALGFEGRLALAWKHWLDQRFLDRYRRLFGPGQAAGE